GNVIWIAPRDELATREKLQLEAQQQISDLEQTRTQTYAMSYHKAADVQKLLSDPTQRILSKRGSAVVDTRTNTLFVQDTPSRLEEVRRLLAKIDVAVRQVMIEARIVEANETFSRNLGVKLGYLDNKGLRGGTPGSPLGSGARVLPSGNYLGSGEQTANTTTSQPTPTFIPDTQNVVLP